MECQRDGFDIPDDITYLNCAYMGPLSHAVVEAGVAGLRRKVSPWEITPPDFFEGVERVRGLFAQVVGGDADGVAVIPSVSYGIATAAANLPLPEGGHIVVLAEQFPSNVYAWRELATRHGGEVRTVPRPADHDWTRAVLDVIDDRTAIVALPYVHWTDGTRVGLEAIGAAVRATGAHLVVDGTQSIGADPFDVSVIEPDFLITSAYKWLLGPYSAVLMWVAPEHRAGVPLEFSWMARKGADEFPGLVDYTDVLRDGARRFDVGETSNFALIPAVEAALEQTLAWGVEEVAAYAGVLTDRIVREAEALGLGVHRPHARSRHLVGIHLGDTDPGTVAQAMSDNRVYVSVRGDAMRVAPHVYNDDGDVDRLVEVLRSTL